jgi:hypothetical protein
MSLDWTHSHFLDQSYAIHTAKWIILSSALQALILVSSASWATMFRTELTCRLLPTLLRGRAPSVNGRLRLSLAYHTGLDHVTQLSSLRQRKPRRRRGDNAIMPKAPKSKKKGNKFYAVRVGRTTGVFQTWDECEMQVCQLTIADDS